MRRSGFPLVAVITLSVLGAPVALAAAPTTDTTIVKDATDSFAATNPCTDPATPGVVTITYNGVFHITDFGGGIFQVTGTQTGTLVFVPDDPSGITYTGHFAAWFGTQSNPPALQFAATDTFAVHVTGSDGSKLTLLLLNHVTRTPAGDIASEFHIVGCH